MKSRCPWPDHHDRTNWKDEPASGGRIKTVCKKRGGFIGSRPASSKEPSA
ncbi:MAG TPA: hypothetical protein VG125_22070 [Pirellulales bacterium]|nr:hypothetical protein [Pirellulales bacterium]